MMKLCRFILVLVAVTFHLPNCCPNVLNQVINFKDLGCENEPQKYVDELISYDIAWNSSQFTPPDKCAVLFIGRGSQEKDVYQVCVLMKTFDLKDCNTTVVYRFEYGENVYTCGLKPPKSCGEDGKYFAIEIRSQNEYQSITNYTSIFTLHVTAVKTHDSKSPINKESSFEKNKSTIIGGVVAGLIFMCLLFVSILVIVIIIKTKKPKPSMQQLQAERRKRNRMLQEQSRAAVYQYRHNRDNGSDSETEDSPDDKINYINVSESNIDVKGVDNMYFEREADDRPEPDGVSDHVSYSYQDQETNADDSSLHETDAKTGNAESEL